MGLVVALGIAGTALAWSPPKPTLAVDSFLPTIGSPKGGSLVRIKGRGFVGPVRVFFNVDEGSIEGAVLSMTAAGTEIDVITPPVLFGPNDQMRTAEIEVESEGKRAKAPGVFIFENEIQHPKIITASPNSGPKSGGTRVTIIGEGFQEPVQVLFADTEARVLTVSRNQIVVESPVGSALGLVRILVRNIMSLTEFELDAGFRYVAPIEVHGVAPNHGRPGTRITIDGAGFIAPVAVFVAGVAAQPLVVTETRIIAIVQPLSSCSSLSGQVEVINVVNGDAASGPEFTYEMKPFIAAVNPRAAVAGKTVTVQLDSPGDYSFLIGGALADVVSRNGWTFRLRIPLNLHFAPGGCTLRGIEGTGPAATRFNLLVVDRMSRCYTERRDSLLISPAEPVSCTLPPLATVLARSCSSRTVTIANERGRANLVISAPDSVTPRTAAIRGGETAQFTLTPGTQLERFRFATNDPKHPLLLVCVSP